MAQSHFCDEAINAFGWGAIAKLEPHTEEWGEEKKKNLFSLASTEDHGSSIPAGGK